MQIICPKCHVVAELKMTLEGGRGRWGIEAPLTIEQACLERKGMPGPFNLASCSSFTQAVGSAGGDTIAQGASKE